MAAVYRGTNRVVAYEFGVIFAVRAERDRLAAVADARFASHDRPGGHEVVTEDGRTDAFVVLQGPAPLSVEFGHWLYQGKDHAGPRKFVQGLHILTGAIGAH